MHRLSKRIRTLVNLALWGALFLGLILILNQMSAPPSLPSGPQSSPPAYPIAEVIRPEHPPDDEPTAQAPTVTPDAQSYPPPAAYPIPEVVRPISTLPFFEVIVQPPSAEELATMMYTPEHTPTPWPSFTPYPTPAVCPEIMISSTVPMQPAADASGSIAVIMAAERRDMSDSPFWEAYSLAVDGQGRAVQAGGALEQIPVEQGFSAYDFFYYSPDGALVMGVSRFDYMSGAPIDLRAGEEQLAYMYSSGGRFLNWYSDSRQALIGFMGGELGLVPLQADWEHPSFRYTHLVVFPFGLMRGAAASPDGMHIVFSYDGTDTYEIWLVEANGCNARRVEDSDNLYGHSFAWSPDGSRIAFFGNGLTVMNADGTGIREIGRPDVSSWYPALPVWSPDSRSLAVIRFDGNRENREVFEPAFFRAMNIFIVDVESGQERPLLPDESTGNTDPAWSPDGRMIVFVSNRSGSSELWVVNVDGSGLRQLTSAGRAMRFPFWRRK